jgi:hypothetical protein
MFLTKAACAAAVCEVCRALALSAVDPKPVNIVAANVKTTANVIEAANGFFIYFPSLEY